MVHSSMMMQGGFPLSAARDPTPEGDACVGIEKQSGKREGNGSLLLEFQPKWVRGHLLFIQRAGDGFTFHLVFYRRT